MTTVGAAHSFRIEWPEVKGYMVCRPAGDLDMYSVSLFREALADVASRARLVIDLSKVTFLDSAGLGALIGGIRRIRESGGQVAVTSTRPGVCRLLETTGFNRIVPICGTVEAAAETFSSHDFT